MNWLGFHAATSAWLIALAIPLIAVYFLKLKRSRVEIPSLVLWRQVLNDQRVNAPFQRFRRNILLWLQLLALLLLALAAMQPFFHGSNERLDRLPILIDVSASMKARVSAGGPTRLDEARKKVQSLIDNLGTGQQISIIAMGQDARRLTGFSDDRRELTQALASLTVDDVTAKPAAALQLAQAMGRSTPFDRALMVSDGNLPELVDADLAFQLDYELVPPGGANLGITACHAQRRSDGRWEVFVAVEGSSEANSSAQLELLLGDQILASRSVAPGPLGLERLSFRVDGNAASELNFRLKADGFDALEADNYAYLALPSIRTVRVYVAPGLQTWRRALAAHADVQFIDSAAAEVDLIVSDNLVDLQRPALIRLSVGILPPELKEDIIITSNGNSKIVDYRKSDALLAHVTITDLLITQQISWAPDVGEKNLDSKSFSILVHGDRGPLLLERTRGIGTDYHMLFNSDQSTLPFRLGFPILAGNLVALTLRAGGQEEVVGAHTGLLPALSATPNEPVEVIRPDGSPINSLADHTGQLRGIPAIHPGFYRVKNNLEAIGASLLDSRETRLVSIEKVQVREVAVTASTSAPSEYSLWRILALCALIAALCEWWYGHRRPIGNMAS